MKGWNVMKKWIWGIVGASLGLMGSLHAQGVTGLADWSLFLDPGHGDSSNIGIYGYPESRKNFEVAKHLREILTSTTDIDTVVLSRNSENVNPGLWDRANLANTLGMDWLHSIHSDAGAPDANSTLMLWGQYTSESPYNCTEKVPNGGKAMSAHMINLLTRGMRTTTRGSQGDCCDFYTWSTWCNSGNGGYPGPYLAMNRYSTMPSELSEAGFHTNAVQNQRNMSDKWKRLEAYTFYWAILAEFNLARPPVSILTGIIYDLESDAPINAAAAAAGGVSDTTDTYAKVFHAYSTNPDQLHNGVYFLEDL
ncbi:MAG: N-acetylmuramoyl-L-alanine amidase, partial [Fidelibacterota bacterium]